MFYFFHINCYSQQGIFDSLAVEYIDWNKVRINGVLPTLTTYEKVKAVVTSKDKFYTAEIHGPCVSYYDKPYELLVFNEIFFEKYFSDTVVFNSMEFDSKRRDFFNTGEVNLNGTTTIEDLKKHFPNSVKNNYSKTQMGDNVYDTVIIPVFSNGISIDKWYLFFYEGKLALINYHMPC